MPPRRRLVVGAAQLATDCDVLANLARVKVEMRSASRRGCQALLFHEGCLTGYPDASQLESLDFDIVAKAENVVRNLARSLGMAVLIGTTSRRSGEIFNDVLIVDECGVVLGRYAKTWRAGEPWYGAGSGPVIFRICGVDATVIICHDLRYPELVRLGVAAGARIVFIANNESGPTAENKLLGYRSMQISRATENLVYAVMANAPADAFDVERSNASHGNSKIVDPLGNILDEAGVFEERLVIGELDLRQATGQPVRRAVGRDPSTLKCYGISCEHPAYADWLQTGGRLVKRLNGS